MSTSSTSGGGVGLGGLLFVAFLVLKLTHVIDWSWWWITAPLWIPAGLSVIAIVFAAIFAAVKS